MTRPYTAVVLGEGFNDPPLRLLPGMRWPHAWALAAAAFAIGVAVWITATEAGVTP